MKEIGLDARMVAFLVEMSRDCNPPSAFDEEVQFYLDQLYNQESK